MLYNRALSAGWTHAEAHGSAECQMDLCLVDCLFAGSGIPTMPLTGNLYNYWNEEEDAEFIAAFNSSVLDQVEAGSICEI